MLDSDELKKLYGTDYVQRFVSLQPVGRIEKLLRRVDFRPEYRVVDYACGSGMLIPFVAPKVRNYVGVDFSEDFILAARETSGKYGFTNVELVSAEIKEFSRTHKGEFDIAFALDFSEHVYDDEWLDLLRAIYGSLKSGGRIYLHTPNSGFFIEIMRLHNIILKQFPEHVAVRSLQQNVELLQQAGFLINDARIIPHYNILKWIHPLSYMPVIGRYFGARVFIEASR